MLEAFTLMIHGFNKVFIQPKLYVKRTSDKLLLLHLEEHATNKLSSIEILRSRPFHSAVVLSISLTVPQA